MKKTDPTKRKCITPKEFSRRVNTLAERLQSGKADNDQLLREGYPKVLNKIKEIEYEASKYRKDILTLIRMSGSLSGIYLFRFNFDLCHRYSSIILTNTYDKRNDRVRVHEVKQPFKTDIGLHHLDFGHIEEPVIRRLDEDELLNIHSHKTLVHFYQKLDLLNIPEILDANITRLEDYYGKDFDCGNFHNPYYSVNPLEVEGIKRE